MIYSSIFFWRLTLKTLAITPPSALSFKQLLEPERSRYTQKQEKLATQVREIINNQNPNSKTPETVLQTFERELDLDLLILPSEHRKTIDVYAKNDLFIQKALQTVTMYT